MLDNFEKAGVANLVATMMNEGTKNKTPEELEDAIGMLGASIRVSAGNEGISITGTTLTKNFEKTIDLVREILLEPRWDEEQFELAKSRIINTLKRNASSATYLSSSTLNKLLFGNNILAVDATGTEASVSNITIDDLKEYYANYVSPSIARFIIAGDVDQQRVETALATLALNWTAKDISIPEVKLPEDPEKAQLYFVDLPGAKQSVISIGRLVVPRNHPDYYATYVANYKLGGSSLSGIFNTILREEKGFTYGASSTVTGAKNYGLFRASSQVRTNATRESVEIFKSEIEKYTTSIPQEYIDFTKSGMMKSKTRSFETLSSLLDMINTMSSYNLPSDYIMRETEYLKGLTAEKQLEVAKKYIDPSKMYYVVVGDAKTQLKELENVGLGKPILLKN
jgi:zinc protease